MWEWLTQWLAGSPVIEVLLYLFILLLLALGCYHAVLQIVRVLRNTREIVRAPWRPLTRGKAGPFEAEWEDYKQLDAASSEKAAKTMKAQQGDINLLRAALEELGERVERLEE